MKVQSGEYPNTYMIRKKNDSGYTIKLRNNIEEKTVENDEGESTYYQYDEIEIKIPIMPEQNIEKFIKNNFNKLWTFYSEDEVFNLKQENADLWYEIMKVV